MSSTSKRGGGGRTAQSDALDLPGIDDLAYPFPAHGLGHAEESVVRQAYDDYEARHHLFDDAERYRDVIGSFVCTCSTPGAGDDALR